MGLGTWFIDDNQVADAAREAAKLGYRHFDTAQAYGNERGVGEGIRTCGVPREELFVVSKVAAEHKTYEEAKAGIDTTLKTMGLDYLDMMIIHSPQPWVGNTPLELVTYCQQHDIAVEAYSPIAHGEILSQPEIAAIADKYGVSVPQLYIRYTLQLGAISLPKTANPEHMKTNSDVDFEISDADMETLKHFKHIDSYGANSGFLVLYDLILAGHRILRSDHAVIASIGVSAGTTADQCPMDLADSPIIGIAKKRQDMQQIMLFCKFRIRALGKMIPRSQPAEYSPLSHLPPRPREKDASPGQIFLYFPLILFVI